MAENSASKQKVLVGEVVSVGMQKSIVVKINFNTIDKRFKKTVRRSKKVMVHDEEEKASLGDIVRIKESRPFSKNKHHILIDISEKASVDEPALAGEA